MAPSPDATVVNPSHVVALSDSWRIDAVVFSADGRSLYVQYQDEMLNLWAVGVHFWPQILGIGFAFLVLVCGGVLLRIARRPQVAGHPHCRRCNYDLSGTGARPCAECGTDPAVRRPSIGRTRLRRAVPWMSVLILAAGTYGSLFPVRARFEHWAASLFQWDSKSALDAARAKRSSWLGQFVRRAARVVEIDPDTGAMRRTIADAAATMDGPLALSPSGTVLVVENDLGELEAIDPRTSRVVSRAPRPDGIQRAGTPFSPGWRHVAGFAPDSAAAFVQCFDDKTSSNTLYRWEFGSSHLTPLLKLDTGTLPRGQGVVRTFYVLAGTTPLLVAEVPDAHHEGLTYGATSGIVLRSLEDGCREVRTITGGFWANAAPHVDPARNAMFVRQWNKSSDDIGMFDLGTGELLGGLKAAGFMGTMRDGLVYLPELRLLYVAGSDPCEITVRDVRSKEWIARLKFPTDGLPPSEFAVSADGRRVAGEYIDTGPKQKLLTAQPFNAASAAAAAAQFRQKLVIFKFPPQPTAHAPESDAASSAPRPDARP